MQYHFAVLDCVGPTSNLRVAWTVFLSLKIEGGSVLKPKLLSPLVLSGSPQGFIGLENTRLAVSPLV